MGLILLSFFLGGEGAWAKGNFDSLYVGALGGLDLAHPQGSVNQDYEAALSGLGGVVVGIPRNEFNVEVGVNYLIRKFKTSNLEVSTKWLQIPVMVTMPLLSIVSGGAGLYYAHGLGNIEGAEGGTLTHEKAELSKTDIGGMLSARVHTPKLALMSLFAELRGSMSLLNVAATEHFYFRELMLLGGVHVGF